MSEERPSKSHESGPTSLTGHSLRLEEFLLSTLRAPALARYRQALAEFPVELRRCEVDWACLDEA